MKYYDTRLAFCRNVYTFIVVVSAAAIAANLAALIGSLLS